jgi:hypothetical protein
MRSFLFGLFCVVAGLTAGCGGSDVAANNGTVNNVSITPNPINLNPTESIQLTAILDGGSAPITWSVSTLNGGSVTQSGIYTAPSVSGTYVVRVELTSNPLKFGTANAIVDSGYLVSIFTAASQSGPFTVPQNGSLQLLAKVAGASSNAVTWSTNFGSISNTGLFSAPASTGTATITATSVTDPGKSVSVPVDVVP